jgi:hypothetical protein
MKYLLFLLLLSSCAGPMIIRGGPETTACGAALDLRIEGYFAKCYSIKIIEITMQDDGTYIGKAECYKGKR